MKRFIIIAIMLTGLYSCEDKNKQVIAPDPEPEWGADSGIATFNGTLWRSNAKWIKSVNDTLMHLALDITKKDASGQPYVDEHLLFWMVKKNHAVQKLDSFGSIPIQDYNSPEGKFFTTVDIDAINEVFNVCRADSLNNWIQIIEQKDDFKKIRGKFSVTLVKSQEGIEYRYPDTIIIRDGVFNISTE